MFRDEIDINVNSIFEMLPDKGSRVVFINDDNKDRLWTEGKRVLVDYVPENKWYVLSLEFILYGVGQWENSTGKEFDAMTLTEDQAVRILEYAIKRRKLWNNQK